MVGPAFAGGPPGDPPGLERAIAAQEAHTDALMARASVVGTAVGLGADGQAVVVIYAASAGVPGLPDQLDGVPVNVVVTGMIVARTDPKARQPRPVPIGVSTGHPDITAGTIGARVTNGTDVFALSNNHVYAAANSASIGDSALQPGSFDGGIDPADAIGTLADFEPILFDGSDNMIDAAIALSSTASLGNATPSDDGYGTPNSTTVSATLGQAVKKYGRTTKLTHGTVSEINVTVNVCYKARGPFSCNRNFIAKFVDQIAISDGNFSAGGDSGSLIVDTNANPVGLLFAGSSTRTIANRIAPVLTRFGVTIDDSTGALPNDPPSVSITGPADGSTFDSGATILFEGTASDTEDHNATLTDSLAWSSSIDGSIGTGGSFSATLSDGDHAITASVTDSGGKTGSASISITVGDAPAEATAVSVSEISYATEGGKNGDKHLLITVALVNDLGSAVSGASVSVTLTRTEGGSWNGTGTTGTGGTVTFSLKNAKSGTYTTTVTAVSAGNLAWDGATPPNSFDK
jgi:hypothetical protein